MAGPNLYQRKNSGGSLVRRARAGGGWLARQARTCLRKNGAKIIMPKSPRRIRSVGVDFSITEFRNAARMSFLNTCSFAFMHVPQCMYPVDLASGMACRGSGCCRRREKNELFLKKSSERTTTTFFFAVQCSFIPQIIEV